MTRANRIKTGFHRIGVVMAALCILPAISAMIFWIQGYPDSWLGVVGSVLAAVALYGIAWAFGWIVAGFAGDSS